MTVVNSGSHHDTASAAQTPDKSAQPVAGAKKERWYETRGIIVYVVYFLLVRIVYFFSYMSSSFTAHGLKRYLVVSNLNMH